MPSITSIIERHVFGKILLFLDDSSHVASCGQGADDIANMQDLEGCADEGEFGCVMDPCQRFDNVLLNVSLYKGSMGHPPLIR